VPGVPVYLPYSAPPALVASVKKAGGAGRSSKEPADICKDAFLTGELGQEIREQSLVLRTPKGLVVLTGCSHPGIIPILERAKEAGGQGIYAVIGGFHLLQHTEPAVKQIISRFKELGVARVAAAHCTGPRSIELFREAYGPGFIEAGAGRVIEIR
jgi:7,8-dihydropterin-6-yl-methyl-4-(beta-D-ribofuranosyl)aminobenzene 5'-phosphate synthase